jgi:hypothetical protein
VTAPVSNPQALGNPYNPAVWAAGYQQRQFGVAGPSVLNALADPPDAMLNAALVVPPYPEDQTTNSLVGDIDPNHPDPTPIYS